MKIFISAHEFSPCLGSECRTGWNLVNHLSLRNDVTVFAANANQMNTEDYQSQFNLFISKNNLGIKKFNIVFVRYPKIGALIAKLNKSLFYSFGPIGNPFLYFLAVKFWEKRVYTLIKQRIESGDTPDAIYHLNHISFREPGYLWKLPIKFYWGPVSGMLKVKAAHINPKYYKLKIINIFRNLLNELTIITNRRIINAAKEAQSIFVVSEKERIFFSRYNGNVEMLLDVGLSENPPIKKRLKSLEDKKLSLSWAGRIDAYKSLEILIHAVSSSNILRENVVINIFGDGPNEDKCKKLVKLAGLDNFKFIGKVDHIFLLEHLNNTDVLVHTSIKEASGSIISESIEINLPFISHYAFGLKQLIDAGMGIGVKLESFQSSINGFKQVLEKIVRNRKILDEMYLNINQNKNNFSWKSMAEKIEHNIKLP